VWRGIALEKIVDVGRAIGALVDGRGQAVHADGAGLDAARQQRQQGNRHAGAVKAGKGGVRTVLRQRGLRQRHADAREHGQRQVAVDRQLAVEPVLHRLRNLRLEAVHVHQRDERDQRHHQQGDEYAESDQELSGHASSRRVSGAIWGAIRNRARSGRVCRVAPVSRPTERGQRVANPLPAVMHSMVTMICGRRAWMTTAHGRRRVSPVGSYATNYCATTRQISPLSVAT
jgi:hypothetical protein